MSYPCISSPCISSPCISRLSQNAHESPRLTVGGLRYPRFVPQSECRGVTEVKLNENRLANKEVLIQENT